MKIGLLVFPTLYDTHNEDSAASDLGQRLEPSVLSLGSQKPGDINNLKTKRKTSSFR